MRGGSAAGRTSVESTGLPAPDRRTQVKEREYRYTSPGLTWPYHIVLKEKTKPDPAFVLNDRVRVKEFPKATKAQQVSSSKQQ